MIKVYAPRRFSSSNWRKPWAEVSSGNCAGGSKEKKRMRLGAGRWEGGRESRDSGVGEETKGEGESQGWRLQSAESS